MGHDVDMDIATEIKATIERVNRLKACMGENVIDIERVRLKRELKAARDRMTTDQWNGFMRELVSALARREEESCCD